MTLSFFSAHKTPPDKVREFDISVIAFTVTQRMEVERKQWFRVMIRILKSAEICNSLPDNISFDGRVEQTIKSFQIISALKVFEEQDSLRPDYDTFAKMLTERVFESDMEDCRPFMNLYAKLDSAAGQDMIFARVRQLSNDLSHAMLGSTSDQCASTLLESLIYDLHNRTTHLTSHILSIKPRVA